MSAGSSVSIGVMLGSVNWLGENLRYWTRNSEGKVMLGGEESGKTFLRKGCFVKEFSK